MKKRVFGGTIVGLDLSLTATAMCALPCPWDFDMTKSKTRIVGKKLTKEATTLEQLERKIEIADAVIEFLKEHQARHVFCEDHAYGAGGSNALNLAGLHDVVRVLVYENWGLVVEPIPILRGRKILLQNIPRKDSKGFTLRNVKRLGGPALEWTGDEVDAFTTVNAGLMLIGATAMTFPGVS